MTADERLNVGKASEPVDRGALPEPVTVGTGRTEVRLEVVRHGRDRILIVGGGEAHVGAVAVHAAVGLNEAAGPVAELTVVPGHKEGPLADECAATLAAVAGGTWVAIVGIHQDEATAAEIQAIVANVRAGLARIADHFRNCDHDGDS